jgi:hypothetical protein
VRLSIQLVVKVPLISDAEATVPMPILFAGKHSQGGLRAFYDRTSSDCRPTNSSKSPGVHPRVWQSLPSESRSMRSAVTALRAMLRPAAALVDVPRSASSPTCWPQPWW